MAGGAEHLIGPAEFEQIIRSARRAVFRLETRQVYREPSEAAWVAAFHCGDRFPPDCPEQDEWEAMLRARTNAGVLFQRVHVVREPLTPYLQFELCWAYPPNARNGELIWVADGTDGWPPGVPQHDFWVIDGARYDCHYTGDGRFLGVTPVGWRVPTMGWVLTALRQSVPLREFLTDRPWLAARALA